MIAALLLVMFAMVATPASVQASNEKASNLFLAALNGRQEVPPRETPARGLATFVFNKKSSEFRFVLVVGKINNVAAAHVHCGAVGVNGPVGVTLFMGTPGSGPAQGVLSHGRVTAPDAGNACGWLTVADVRQAMKDGNAYVNVHTNDGVAPTNTGPGDFPGGEIRGQVR